MTLAHRNDANAQLLEKVITTNDLGGLSAFEKVQHIKNVCESLGLNPLTKPIQLLKFQGKEIAYFTKDATEQLRKMNKVSITKIDKEILEGIYVVTVYARTPDGREDSSTGAITIAGLKGDALCNAMLKAETKAKRRVTLSICGLGYIDESEAESIPNSQKVDVYDEPKPLTLERKSEVLTPDIDDILLQISQVDSLDELERLYKHYYKEIAIVKDRDSLQKLIAAKDKKKDEIENIAREFFNEETGEV